MLAWVRKDKVPYTIRPGTVTLGEQQARAAPAPQPTTPIAKAMHERDAARSREEQETATHCWSVYRRLLVMGGTRTEQDNVSLLGVSEDLGLSAEQVERHQAAVDAAMECEAAHADLVARHTELTRARQELADLEDRHKTEHAQLERKFHGMTILHHRAAAAGGHLRRLAKDHPVLFDTSRDTPVLRRD